MTRPFRLALAALAAVLFWFSLGLTPLWASAWLAPIPLLVAAFHSRGWEGAFIRWAVIAVGLSSNFAYYLKTTGPVATVVLVLLQILMWGFFIDRTRAAVLSSKSWTVVFFYPLLTAGFSTLIAFFSPHGTWGSFAYTQMEALPVIQIASLAGAPAISFLLALFASAVSVAIYRGPTIQRPLLAYGLPGALLAGALAYGEIRLHTASPEPTVRVGLASVDDFIGPRMPVKLNADVWQRYADLVAELAHAGARIVMLPEKISRLSGNEIGARKQQLAQLAQQKSVFLVAGVELDYPDHKDNALWLFSPNGGLISEYHKQRLVPYLESDLKAGHTDDVQVLAGAPFGLSICRDMIFSDLGRSYGRAGVAAMLVPAWDFYRDAWMESAVATLRGVENGYSVVRAGRESYLQVSDRFGNVIARKRSENLPGIWIAADLPLGNAQPTLYARYGDVFGWVCVTLSVALVIVGILSKKSLINEGV